MAEIRKKGVGAGERAAGRQSWKKKRPDWSRRKRAARALKTILLS